MFTPRVVSPGSYDSMLQSTLNAANPNQNAWLTIELKVSLNFVDSVNQMPGLTVNDSGRWCASDADHWLFPLLNWTPDTRKTFADTFKKMAESTWNYKFMLMTPRDYTDLDFTDYKGGWMVRPNVICGFRVHLVGSGTTVPPSKTISGNLDPHQTINVVRLDRSTTNVHRYRKDKTDNGWFTKKVGPMTGSSWRSNANSYDDLDLSTPGHNTIGHEIGHVLGEGHIKCLGNNPLPICAKDANDDSTYGFVDSDSNDAGNVMGRGTAVTLANADPWTWRMMRHTLINFPVTQAVHTPPRRLHLSTSIEGKSTF